LDYQFFCRHLLILVPELSAPLDKVVYNRAL
jgi:hypothetical protein